MRGLRGRSGRKALVGIGAAALVAALVVFVLPALAASAGDPQPPASGAGVTPQLVDVGGSTFSCSAIGSPATSQFQINNPKNNTTYTIPGTSYSIRLTNIPKNDTTVTWAASGGIVVLDLGVNGGSQSTWYRYRPPLSPYAGTSYNQGLSAPAYGVTTDSGVHAPLQSENVLYSLSYMTFCYSPTTSIGGRVFNDVNGNGADNSEPGIANQTVNLYRDGAATPTATTTSTSSGAYSFTGQPAGSTYKVCVSSVAGSRQTVPVNTACTGSGEASGGVTFALGASPRSGDAFGFQQVGSIGGRVFNDLNGNGADNTEPGIPGRAVNAYLGTATTPTASGTTDSTGAYTIPNLSPGSYRVCAASGGWVQSAPGAGTGCSGTGEGANGASVTVAAGGSAAASFGFYNTATLSGSVLDSAGNGLARTVNLYLDGATSPSASTTSTGGAYSFPAERVGATYKVCVVNLTGWSQTAPAAGAQTCTGSGEAANPATGTVVTGGSTAATFRFVALASISGRVFNDANRNGADDTEAGLPVTVSLFQGVNPLAVATTSSAADGSFSFPSTPVGSGYKVCVSYPSATWRQTAPAPDPSASCAFPLAPNGAAVTLTTSNVTGLSFGLVQQASISGTIFDDANVNGSQDSGESGVAGRAVFLYKDGVLVSGSFQTDGSGAFSFGAQDVGAQYKVCVAAVTGQAQTYPTASTTGSATCGATGETAVGWGFQLTSDGKTSLGFGSVAAIPGSCGDPFGSNDGYKIQLAGGPPDPCDKQFVYTYDDTTAANGGLASLVPVPVSSDAKTYAMIERITWSIPADNQQFDIRYDDILPYLSSQAIPMLYCNLDPRSPGSEFGVQSAYYSADFGGNPGLVIPNYPSQTSCIVDENTSTSNGKYVAYIYSSIDGLRLPNG